MTHLPPAGGMHSAAESSLAAAQKVFGGSDWGNCPSKATDTQCASSTQYFGFVTGAASLCTVQQDGARALREVQKNGCTCQVAGCTCGPDCGCACRTQGPKKQ